MYDNQWSSQGVPLCAICHAPVPLNAAKTDEDGEAVHEDCYLLKVGVTNAASNRGKVAS